MAYIETLNSFNIAPKDAVRAFATVADMQAATDLAEGMVCHTNGFHEEGDGGAAYYIISTEGTANGMDVLACEDGLKASIAIADAVHIKTLGAIGDGVSNDSEVFARTLDVAMQNGIPAFIDSGTYLLDPLVFQSVERSSYYTNLTIKGAGKYQSTLKLNNTAADQYFSNSSTKQIFGRLNFHEIGFTGNTTEANGFYCYSTGNEKQYRFYDCYFKLANVLYCAGTGNADLHRFYNCSFETYGTIVTLDNAQSVGTELYGCTGVLYGSLVKQIQGGVFRVFGGAFDSHGTDGNYVFDCSESTTGLGNRGICCTGTRFEFHNQHRFINATSGKATELTFTDCNFGSADSLSSGYYATIYKNACVYFTRCVLASTLKFYVYTTGSFLGDSPMGALLKFDDCSSNSRIYSLVTCDGNFSRVIANGCIMIATNGNLSADDFDYNFMQRSTDAIPATTKIYVFKKNGAGYPKAGDHVDAILPPNSFVKRIKVYRPAIAGITAAYQLHVGTQDESTIYAETASTSTFADAIDLDIPDVGFVSNGIVRMWATGSATNITLQGYAYIEYI